MLMRCLSSPGIISFSTSPPELPLQNHREKAPHVLLVQGNSTPLATDNNWIRSNNLTELDQSRSHLRNLELREKNRKWWILLLWLGPVTCKSRSFGAALFYAMETGKQVFLLKEADTQGRAEVKEREDCPGFTRPCSSRFQFFLRLKRALSLISPFCLS